jgi:hypothetical protein
MDITTQAKRSELCLATRPARDAPFGPCGTTISHPGGD